MGKLVIFILVFLLPHVSCSRAAQNEKEWYYPWANTLDRLEPDNNYSLPLLQGGSNYRVLKIVDFQGSTIEEIKAFGNKTTVDFFYLPPIKSYSNQQILDLMLPINRDLLFKGNDAYFLLKFNGKNAGEESIEIKIRTNKRSYIITKHISVSKSQFVPNLDLNIWAYFDYNYLVKGLKNQMLADLVDHNVSTIVIPPYVLPSVTNISKNKIDELGVYLNQLGNKFKHYIVYFGGFQDRKDDIMTNHWKANYPLWLNSISKVFIDNNIPFDKVILYPYDEPRGLSINKLNSLIDYTKQLNVKNKFFVTLSNIGSEQLAKKIDIVQVHSDVPGLLTKVIKSKGKSTSIWIYETKFNLSNTISPKKYLYMSYKASKNRSTGIGIWSYADVKRQDLSSFNRGLGTWEFNEKRYAKDYEYSLIYRKGDLLFSSIRWEALSFGLEEFFWLELYEQKHGSSEKAKVIGNLLENRLTVDKWESIKLALIRSKI